MKQLKKACGMLCSASLLLASQAQASLISQYTEISSFQRSCPGLADAQYVNKWRGALVNIFGSNFTTEQACWFNSRSQSSYYHTDGTPKIEGFPQGVPFTSAEVGVVRTDQQFGASQVELGEPAADIYGKVTLDKQNLGLPEFKLRSQSQALERDAVHAFAATEYEWLGDTTTLDYQVNFDFFSSDGEWAMDGAVTHHDFRFFLLFGVSQNMIFSYLNPFQFDYGNVLTTSYFYSDEMPLFSTSAEQPFEGSLNIAFTVKPGERFWLWGQVQAAGFNGGYVDASHTVTSNLAVVGLDQPQSQQLLSTALKKVPNQVPTPAGLMLLVTGLFLLRYKKRG